MHTAPSAAKALHMTLRNTLAELSRLNQAVQAFLEKHAAPAEAVFATHLALEEMVTNIVKYGYDDTLAHAIDVTLTREPERLTIRIEDDGHAFNPLNLPPPDTSPHLEKREIGGLGIHLVRNSVADIWYQRRAGRNLLNMAIRL